MSTFDIQSIAPEGYEVVSVESYVGAKMQNEGHELISFDAQVTVRKKWTPKLGEVVAVRDHDDEGWSTSFFFRMEGGKFIANHDTDGDSELSWKQCRQLTPEERGE